MSQYQLPQIRGRLHTIEQIKVSQSGFATRKVKIAYQGMNAQKQKIEKYFTVLFFGDKAKNFSVKIGTEVAIDYTLSEKEQTSNGGYVYETRTLIGEKVWVLPSNSNQSQMETQCPPQSQDVPSEEYPF